MAKPRCLVWLCLGLLLLVACPAGAATDSPYGMGVYLYRLLDNPDQMNRVAELARQAGVAWTREEFHWQWIEPYPGDHDWAVLAKYDAMVEAARSRGMEVMGLLAYCTDWVCGDGAPRSQDDYDRFASYAAFMVDRYKDRIKYWEIWNEPNHSSFWPPSPDAYAYTQLLATAHRAIKAVDPSAMVVGGSVAGIDLDYANQLLYQGAGRYMDAISVHAYPYPASLERSDYGAKLLGLKGLMQIWGADRPIYLTEMGYATYDGTYGVTRSQQAAFLVRSYLTAISLGIKAVFGYDFRDDGLDSGNREDNFGLVTHQDANPSLSPKESYQAFKTMVEMMSGARYQESLWLDGWNEGMIFSHPDTGKTTVVAWVAEFDGQEGQAELALELAGTVDWVRDMGGNHHFHRVESGSWDYKTLHTTISAQPVYIRGDFRATGPTYDLGH